MTPDLSGTAPICGGCGRPKDANRKCKPCISAASRRYRARLTLEQRREQKRRWRERAGAMYLERGRRDVARYQRLNTKKRQASRMVLRKKASGRLIPQPCEVCGETKVVAHHDDYDKPLEVRWLCHPHHCEHHKIHGEGKNAR